MNDQQIKPKKPRKILGNGSSLDYSIKNNNFLQQTNQPNLSFNNINYTTPNNLNLTNTSPLNITASNLQQQQMERLRLANVMNQEMHALWPYGSATFLTPMVPAHNIPLPYALAGTLPYAAAVPIYQSLPNTNVPTCTVSPATTSSSSSGSSSSVSATANQQNQNLQHYLLRSNSNSNNNNNYTCSSSANNNQNSVNDSNKINIQIGLQCVSQNTPVNINSMNDSFGKVNLLNVGNPSSQIVEKDVKETNSSLRNSPVLLNSGESTTIQINGAGGDATNSISSPGSSNGTVTLSQAKFNELTLLALRGCEIAEKLAQTHRNRPCFKKIDSLCARMKQDLTRPDGVLPNINSQGIAWAVKDFIFVFTRVINAWIIIKGYVYNTPEGLNKVKATLSPDFAASFIAWQDTTMDFIENLIKSFINLDNLVQSQKNVYQKNDNPTSAATANTRNSNLNNTTSTPIKILQPGSCLLEESFDFLNSSAEKCAQNSLNKNYIYTMVEDSESSHRQAAVNGTYFRTGTYTPPILKDTLFPAESCLSNNSIPIFAAATNNDLEQYIEHLNEFWSPTSVDMELSDNVVNQTNTDYVKLKENMNENWLNYDLRVLQQHLSEFSSHYDANAPARPLGKDLIDKLNVMIERLNCMKTADLFFKLQFTENYFPDFVAKHKNDFMDIRSIIFKCQIGGYLYLSEVVHDVRKIIYVAKEFLKVSGCFTLNLIIL